MSQYLPFIVIGLTTGSIYGLAGIGLVLTYKTTGIFNFGYGAVAALSAFLYYFLRQQHGFPWPVAFVVCLLVCGVGFGLAFERLARFLNSSDTTIKVAATVGIILVIVSAGTLWYPGSNEAVSEFLPQGTIDVFSVYVTWAQIIIFFGSIVVTCLLYALFRWFRLGVAMRAAVDNPQLLARTGENPITVRRWACVLGALLAAASGMLIAPGLGLDALILTMLVVQAFGAAAIGMFSSLPITYAGGLGIGVVVALATKFTAQYPTLGGVGDGLPFIILFIVLIVTPKRRLLDRSSRPEIRLPRPWHAPPRVRAVSGIVALVVLGAVPTFAGVRLIDYSDLLVITIVFLSLGLLVKISGQSCLCQMTFVAIGASTAAHLSAFGIPWLFAILLAGLIVVPIGAVVAIPAIRLEGIYLALATFGFGIFVEQMFFPMNFLFGVSPNGIPTNRPSGGIGSWHFGTNRGYYYVLLVFLAVVVGGLLWIERGRLGRLMRAMTDSPRALQSGGTSLVTAKVLIFCISAFVAAIAGGLSGSLFQFAESTQYTSFSSLTLFAAVVILTMGGPWYALVGAFGLTLIPAYLTSVTYVNTYLQLFFGVSALMFVFVAQKPPSVPMGLRKLLTKLGGPAPQRHVQAIDPSPKLQVAVEAPSTESAVGLEVEDLSVSYGGLRAVSEVSLHAPMGRITGLVGPNGAGKTSLFAACSGIVRPQGRVKLGGREITRKSPQERAQLGLGRTFQQVELYDSLTVAENVALGREALFAGREPWNQLFGSRGDRRTIDEAVESAMSLASISEIADRQVGVLSTGQRRLVELARALAGTYDVLLLDEPSSGLDAAETLGFGRALVRAVDERGIGILLVEHDMALVRAVCAHVYMLEFGRLIFEGSPDEMHSSEVVRAAYLGVGAEEIPHDQVDSAGSRAVPSVST